ncbi:hypothetical protein [Neobacillus bataviensis]|nr:hypothetical protein [Neobacillus bataviensis]
MFVLIKLEELAFLHGADEGQISVKIKRNVLHKAIEGQISVKVERNVLHN